VVNARGGDVSKVVSTRREGVWWNRDLAPLILMSSLCAGGWPALRPDPLHPVGNNTVTIE
jgi:hypothetical protein